jgi:hypothetical protein
MGQMNPSRRIDIAAWRRRLAPQIKRAEEEAARRQAEIDKAVAEDQLGYVWWHHWEPKGKRK